MTASTPGGGEEGGGGGRVVTFYSYKGGTGRSMALANVAWVLASAGKRVLCVDWDLEAPGLHRYFAPFLIDPDLFSSDGVIDFVWEVSRAAVTPPADAPPNGPGAEVAPRDFAEFADPSDYLVRLDYDFPGDGALDLLPAGRQGPLYAERVNTFDWDNFYERLGGGRALAALFARLRAAYDVILLDSRTGVSDTSGICTVQLPDAIVALFTLNKQSMRGAEAIARSVREQRPEMPIYPVPTRVDPFETDKMQAALRQAKATFAPFLADLERAALLREGGRDEYWGDVEFAYQPYYSYEEVLAPFKDERGRKATLLATASRIAGRIAGAPVGEPPPVPEELREYALRAYAHGDARPEPPPMGPPRTAATQTMEAPAYAHPLAPAATSSVAPPAAPPNVAQSVPAPPRAVSPVLAGAAAPARGGAGRLARWGGAAALGVTILAALTAKYRGASTDGPTGAELKAGPRLPSRDDSIARLSAGDTVPAPERRALLRALNAAHALHGAVNLSGLDLGGARLVGIDLSSATLHETKLVNAQLDSANLTGADLTGADLTNARLLGANLSGARVAGASFDGANLFGATLDGVRLDSARTNAATVLRDSTPGPYRRDEDVAAAAPAAPASGARAEGYVWIGNYDRAQAQWEKVRIADSAGTPLTRDPALMRVGATYVLRGDLTLRRDWPQQGPEYFAAVVPLGWLPSGTTVTLRAEPRAYVRAGRTQYWARVEVDRVGVRR